MAEEQKRTVAGEVMSIGKWPSGKGYFTNLRGDENDYYYFGGLKADVGESVVFEVTKGTGNYSDKWQVQRRLREAPQPTVNREMPKVEHEYIKDEPGPEPAVYMATQESIAKQCCIKAAARLVGEIYPRKAVTDWKAIAHTAMDVADIFYLRLVGVDDRIDDTGEE